jgi:cell division protein FtsB
MRDIGSRIKRYRLSRYAAPEDRVRRRLRWVWVLAALWVIWIGAVSDHSLLRIWILSQQNAQVQHQLASARTDIDRVDRDLHDARSARIRAEKELREKHGMAREGEIVYRIRDDAPDSLRR